MAFGGTPKRYIEAADRVGGVVRSPFRSPNERDAPPLILVVDNYDSYVYNLVQYVGRHRSDVVVRRNDAVTPAEALGLAPRGVIISPGPRAPEHAGCSIALVKALAGRVPILGVCLGHQCIARAYGGVVERAPDPWHGKASLVRHAGDELFDGVPERFAAGRYHSLHVRPGSLPGSLSVTATTTDGTIMAIRDRSFPVFGVQFHPESVLTPYGRPIVRNFLSQCAAADCF